MPLPHMARKIVLTLKEVIDSAYAHWTRVICGSIMDGVDVATEVLPISGGWC